MVYAVTSGVLLLMWFEAGPVWRSCPVRWVEPSSEAIT